MAPRLAPGSDELHLLGEQRCEVELVGSLLNPASSMQRWLRTSWEEVEDSLAEGELQRLEGSVLSEIATAEGLH